jgi:thioredoxin-like negative regulator of GroEL
MSIPNFVLFKEGKPVDQFIGAVPLEDFEDRLKKHL